MEESNGEDYLHSLERQTREIEIKAYAIQVQKVT